MSSTAILFLAFGVSILLYVPIAYALGIGVLAVMLINGTPPVDMFFSTLYTSGDSFTILAVPFFVLSGDVMSRCGISKRLVNMARALLGNTTGSMGMVTVMACMFFAAISGSGLATAAAIGGIMIPVMTADNYDTPYACALTSCSSAIGPVIPPSVPFIIYGVLVSVSVTDLFLAGAIPGIIMGAALMIANYLVCKKKGYGNKKIKEKLSRRDRLKVIWDAKWSILVPIIILGGIYSGIFTPTEAAVVATVYSLIIGLFVYKELKITDMPGIIKSSSISVGLSLALLGFATIFGRILVLERIPASIADAIYAATTNKFMVLMLINAALLVAGMFLETIAAITITAPILLAIAQPYGISPLHLGVIMVCNLAIGLSTPPVGASLFVSAAIGKVKIEETFKPLIILLVASIAALLVITYCEPLVTFLPNLLGGGKIKPY